MKLATIRTTTSTAAVRIDDDAAIELGPTDLVDFLADPDWRERARDATGPRHDLVDLDYAPLVIHPEKIVCVGLNYRAHILEMGRDLPAYPTLFAKYARSLVGAFDAIELPLGSVEVDWEAELGVVIGAPVRAASLTEAQSAIAGFTVVNDISARDFQNRTLQWLQGKTFERSTPVGPWLVVDEAPPGVLSCRVDDELMQEAATSDLVFDAAALVAYISQIVTLVPGDLIATGTPGGVGHARRPAVYLRPGMTVTTEIEHVGMCRNATTSTVLSI
jgi:acylpyruvate hydrolase